MQDDGTLYVGLDVHKDSIMAGQDRYDTDRS
jgi:hypothetical protein